MPHPSVLYQYFVLPLAYGSLNFRQSEGQCLAHLI